MRQRVRVIFEIIMISVFFLNEFANIVSFYLTGNESDIVRKLVSWSVMLIIAVILNIYLFYQVWISKNNSKSLFFMFPSVVVFFLLLIGCIMHNGNSIVLKEILLFFIYCLPMVGIAVYIIKESSLEYILQKVKYIGIILLPFFVYAIFFWSRITLSMTIGNDYYDSIGGISYLQIGYTAAFMYALLEANFLLTENKIEKIVIWIMMCIYVIVAILSGGRGPAMAVIVSFFMSIIYRVFNKKCKVKAYSVGLLFVVIVFLSILPSDNVGISRQILIFSEIEQGDLAESVSSEASNEIIEEIMNNAQDGIGMQDTMKEMSISAKNVQEKEAVKSVTNGSMARTYLFRLAVNETLDNPITGMGPMGFQMKYHNHVHNIVLGAFADFGVLGGMLYCAVCLWIVFNGIKYSINNTAWGGLLIVSGAYLIQYCLSGDVYLTPGIVFLCSIVLAKKYNIFDKSKLQSPKSA